MTTVFDIIADVAREHDGNHDVARALDDVARRLRGRQKESPELAALRDAVQKDQLAGIDRDPLERWPLARAALLAERAGTPPGPLPPGKYQQMPEGWHDTDDLDATLWFQSEWDGKVYVHESALT